MRSVDIIGPHSDKRQLKAPPVRAHQHFCSSFARRVWVRWRQHTRLAKICSVKRHVSIYLICRNVYELVHAMFPRSFKQHVCAIYVRVGEFVRVAEAQVDVRLRSEVEDCVNLVLAKHTLYVYWRCDISVLECEVILAIENARIVEGRAVVELVEGDDIVMAGVREDEVADEPTCTGVQSVLFLVQISQIVAMQVMRVSLDIGYSTYMKPAPPVTKMFFASGNASNLVLPMSTGACFQRPSST